MNLAHANKGTWPKASHHTTYEKSMLNLKSLCNDNLISWQIMKKVYLSTKIMNLNLSIELMLALTVKQGWRECPHIEGQSATLVQSQECHNKFLSKWDIFRSTAHP